MEPGEGAGGPGVTAEAREPLHIDIITLFPEMFRGPFDHSIIRRARDAGRVHLELHQLRDFAEGPHRQVDDYPYGGGPGMVLKPEPLARALESLPPGERVVVLLSPQGEPFSQRLARALATARRLVLVCGHYEGVDERIRLCLIDREVSIGDYVLTGGELPAMVLVDAVVRLLPGVLGHEDSPLEESFQDGLLEFPHYTRPRRFRGLEVPAVLLSGQHERIARWRKLQAIRRTMIRRPDLLARARFREEDLPLLGEALARSAESREAGGDDGEPGD